MELSVEEIAKILRYFGLNEALRSDQSQEAMRAALECALNEWPSKPGQDMKVIWTFGDRLIAVSWMNDNGDFERTVWEIPYTVSGDGMYQFGTPVAVKEIQLYEPKMQESAKGEPRRFSETLTQSVTLVESVGGLRRIRAVGITADVVNGNKRFYPRQVLAEAVAKLNGNLRESAGQGRLIATGEAEHPGDKSGRANILETVVKWEASSLDAGGKVLLEGVILPTQKGKDLQALVENGVPVGVSMRGYGSYTMTEMQGEKVQKVSELTIAGFDMVAQPSDPNGWVTESQQAAKPREKGNMTLEELLKLLQEKPELRESLMKQLGLTDSKSLAESLGTKSLDELTRQFAEAQRAQKELEERQRREAIDKAITEACVS